MYLVKLKIVNFSGILPVGQVIVVVVAPDIYVILLSAPLPLPVVLVILADVVAFLLLPELSGRVVPDQSSAK